MSLAKKDPFIGELNKSINLNMIDGNDLILTKKSLNIKTKSIDHSYSGANSKLINSDTFLQIHRNEQQKVYSPKEKKITNISDLKKATPRLKLPQSLVMPSIEEIPDKIRTHLHKYCRTCATTKYPLIDIFSEKGFQMKLYQQMEHLHKINESDNLSTQLCMDCICDLRVSYNFFVQIKKAEQKLQIMSNSLRDSLFKKLKSRREINSDESDENKVHAVVENCHLLENIKEEISSNESDNSHCDEREMGNTSNMDDKSIEEFDPDEHSYFTTQNITEDSAETRINIPRMHPSNSLEGQTLMYHSNDKGPSMKIDLSKISLKDAKIPIDDPTNIRTEEDGIMYVRMKGSNPNETLLIKVKKMDKAVEKKTCKSIIKKIDVQNPKRQTKQVLQAKIPSDNITIEKQIEQYKKKRKKILGDNKIISASENDTDTENNNQSASEINNGSSHLNNQSISNDEVLQSKDILQMSLDLEENNEMEIKPFDRLKDILKTDDDCLEKFLDNLKQRKILISKLKNEDVVKFFNAYKNFENLDEIVINCMTDAEVTPEEVDPFLEKLSYDCDFCFQSYSTRDMQMEHSKIHDFKLCHICVDCGEKFKTNKAKKLHTVECIRKVICKHCNEILESRGKKRQHEQKHCDEEYGQLCDICGEKLRNQNTLDQHIKSRHLDLEKIFECPKCKKKFAFRTKLTFHIKTVHTTNREYLCEDCGAAFKNPATLRHHRVRKHQNVNARKECPVCKKSVPAYSLSKHMHTHREYTIKCPQCDKKFKNSSTLKQHIRVHEDRRQYKCDICKVGFNRRDGLKLHLKVHQKTDSRGLKECSCQICGEKFPNHSMLVIHRNRTHKDGKTYTCYICNRSMISPRSLEWHLSHIHNEPMPGVVQSDNDTLEPTKRVSCYHCDKTFKTEMILRTHVKNAHVEKEPVKCLDCELRFTSEVRLRHHMMMEHGRLEGTLKCPHCPKRFVNQLRLKTHMIAHSDERPFTCEVCGFTLKTKIQLIKHQQNRHSDERPLQCRYCPWRCKQVSALVCHERTHTNERPYTCSVCKQKFKYLGDKNKHERRHESLGGSGFKRIVASRNLNNKGPTTRQQNDQDGSISEPAVKDNDPEEKTFVAIDDQSDLELKYQNASEQYIKYEDDDDDMMDAEEAEAEAQYEQMYMEGTMHQDLSTNTGSIETEDGTIYTEEVTADSTENEIITSEIMANHILQSGTVVHLQHEDADGKVQVIPVMLSLPDLNDENSTINLENASIMYTT